MNNDNTSGRPAPQRRQYFDVVRPGMAPASPTSRPVIAQPQQPDPVIAPKPVTPPAAPAPQPAIAPLAQVVQSPQPPIAPTPPVAAPAPQAPPASIVDRLRTQPAQQQPAAGSPAPAPVPVAPPEKPQTPDPQDFFKPDSKPANAKAHKRSIVSEILAIVAIVVLLAAIVDILLDAEIINLPLPHTNFFDY